MNQQVQRPMRRTATIDRQQFVRMVRACMTPATTRRGAIARAVVARITVFAVMRSSRLSWMTSADGRKFTVRREGDRVRVTEYGQE